MGSGCRTHPSVYSELRVPLQWKAIPYFRDSLFLSVLSLGDTDPEEVEGGGKAYE